MHSGSEKKTHLERDNRHRQRAASRGNVDRPPDAERPPPPAQREPFGQRHLPPRPRQAAADEAVLPGPPKRHPPGTRVHVHAQRQLCHCKREENLAQLQPRRWLHVPLNGLAEGGEGRRRESRGGKGGGSAHGRGREIASRRKNNGGRGRAHIKATKKSNEQGGVAWTSASGRAASGKKRHTYHPLGGGDNPAAAAGAPHTRHAAHGRSAAMAGQMRSRRRPCQRAEQYGKGRERPHRGDPPGIPSPPPLRQERSS